MILPKIARQKQLEITFKMSQKQRFQEGIDMINFVKTFVENMIKQKYLLITENELKIAVFRHDYKKDFSETKLQQIIQHFNNRP